MLLCSHPQWRLSQSHVFLRGFYSSETVKSNGSSSPQKFLCYGSPRIHGSPGRVPGCSLRRSPQKAILATSAYLKPLINNRANLRFGRNPRICGSSGWFIGFGHGQCSVRCSGFKFRDAPETLGNCYQRYGFGRNPRTYGAIPFSETLRLSLEEEDDWSVKDEPSSNVHKALENIGLTRRSVKLLIKSNPELSTLSLSLFTSTIRTLETLGITGSRLVRLIKKHPTSLFELELDTSLSPALTLPGFDLHKLSLILFTSNPRSIHSIKAKISLLSKHKISETDISGIINRINLRLFLEKSLLDLEMVLVFLHSLDGEHKHVLRHPSLLLLDLKTDLEPRISYFRSLVPDSGALSHLLWRFPVKKWFTVDYLNARISFFRSIGFSDEDIRAVLRSYPQVFTLSIDRNIKPKVEFLQKCGLNDGQIVKTLTVHPSFLGLSFDGNLDKKAKFLTEIGFRPWSVTFARVLTVATRIGYRELTWTVEMLRKNGFTCDDIVEMCERQPHVLKYTWKCLGPKVDYLVGEMGYKVGEVVRFPAYLGYSLEDRIRPRHEAMQWLISRGLIKEGYSINHLLTISNRDFARLTAGTGFCEDAD
ncbi:transcription termination factor MTERF8, chloroplastic [Amborella trichopoda]|uniref:Uncharacterized protein n=1 Tax=Amborella trichopoda TaxID=13333 RepID=W1PU01_AMBTC|nr:transcription termination factor MTERF8, chloroplastic [Amborella trichopoda]ERN11309.1 hypothetical protein AMTR_s00024p00246250 [Amborella trichopoda]|eukprot:XP_006849728.1 transcription termination factor MTERF8, chloroplastic [Amborella trichopoda]